MIFLTFSSMEFSIELVVAFIALIIALLDLWYTIRVKVRMFHTLEKIELEQKRGIFESIYTKDSPVEFNTENVVELAKRIKEAIASKLKLKPGLTYPQLISELEKKGIPADLKDLLSDMFNRVMRIEYANQKEEDTAKIIEEARRIIKTLGLSQSTIKQSK